MLESHLEEAGFRIQLLHDAAGEYSNTDRWVIQPHGSTLRIGVVDGSSRSGHPALQWAPSEVAAIITNCASEGEDLTTTQEAVSERGGFKHSSVATADCRVQDGEVTWEALTAGSCEVWGANTIHSVPTLRGGGKGEASLKRGKDRVVIVSTDGCLISEAVSHNVSVADLDEWFKSVREREGRDDITCVIAYRDTE